MRRRQNPVLVAKLFSQYTVEVFWSQGETEPKEMEWKMKKSKSQEALFCDLKKKSENGYLPLLAVHHC